MVPRRVMLPLLAVLAMMAGVVPAAADGATGTTQRLHHGGVSAKGLARFVQFLHAHEAIDHVAVRDVDNDGDLDVIAAPRAGGLVLWRNAGHGRFALATLPGASRFPRGPRVELCVHHGDDGAVWGVDRYDAAIARAPSSLHAVVPIALVRTSAPDHVHPVSLRRSSGRAPPVLA